MASYFRHYNTPTGNFQRPNQVNYTNESDLSHSRNPYEQNSSPAPFFLQRPAISSEIASKLIPIDVDLHTKKNMEEHSTNHYDILGLVLRRGQPFSFTVTFNRDFDPEEYQLFVRLAIGSRSMISKRTQIRLLVDGKSHENDWSAKKLPNEEENKKKNNRISLQVNSPSDAIIGKYALLLEVRPIKKDAKDLIDKHDLTLFLFEVDVYFLFNPWRKDDSCALSSPEQIAEYVMNEHGQIYLGSSDKPQSIPWYYGQFERSVLLTALALLDKAQLPPQSRTDPSILLRILSSKICSNPGTNGGIFPSSFDTRLTASETNGYTSSSAILKGYLASNGRSVQGGSGSNWVHAAVLCSLSRSLGIPCRIVTVYNAANRADGTENNDIHWDTKQRPLKRLNSDCICSAHVWNECWMRRDDLSNNELDWQIVDSTPVIMCDGIRRTGPCSVSSLKKGELGFRWDSPYVRSSINGNKFHWIVYPDGYMELLDVQENTIGTKIITRSLTDEFQPEDITDHYKHSIKSSDKKDDSKDDVSIELKIPDDIKFGDNIIIELNANNKSKEVRSLTAALTVYITSSTSQRLLTCYNQAIQKLNLESGKDGNIQLKIRSDQYFNYGKEDNITVKYYLHSQINETDQVFIRDDNVIFSKDDIIKPILDEDVIEIGKPVLLQIQIANTLSRPLQNGRIHIDGLGINQILSINRSFSPKESTIIHTKLYPTRIGVSRLYVTFISNDVTSLTQSVPLEIVPEPIKKHVEPLLKKNIEISPEKTDEKPEIKETVTETITHDKSPTNEQQNPLSPTGRENHDKDLPTISPKKSDLSTNEDEDTDEHHLKDKQTNVHPNTGNHPSTTHGSTLSLDKDKISLDSLDISNDHRHAPNNNNNN